MGSSSYVLLLINFFVLTSVFLDARIVADSEGSNVVNTDEVDNNDGKCSPPDGVFCTAEYAPVKCENDCTYSNLCWARAAQQLKCCRIPDVNVMCMNLYAPVKCENDCTYSNLCFAFAAQQLKCCRIPDDNVMCMTLYAPVKCENDCTYSNLCFAVAAQQLKCCPIPDEDIACPTIYDPITCADGCAYENDCYAEAAGFKLTTCVREPIKETTENDNSYGGDQKLVF